MKSRTVTFYDLPVLDVIYPSTVKIEMTGKGRYTLMIHAKPATKQVRAEIIRQLTSAAGHVKTEAKARASRENGKKGGRPKKS